MALKYAPKPVVAAPFGLTLGGACEVALHAARVQASAETYMGLVEVGVGTDPRGRRVQGDGRARRRPEKPFGNTDNDDDCRFRRFRGLATGADFKRFNRL